MATQVIQVQKKDDSNGLLGLAGGLVGSYFGGPAGGAVGSQAGNMAAGSGGQPPAQVASNPRDRAMAKMGEDPVHQLQQGKAAAAKLDPETQKEISPVLEEALKRAFEQRKSQTGAV